MNTVIRGKKDLSDSLISTGRPNNLPIILASIVLACNLLTHLTAFIPIVVGALLALVFYEKKASNRWIYVGFTAFCAVTGYFLLENAPAHAFFLNNLESYTKSTFGAAGSNTQVNTALTIAFGVIRFAAIGAVLAGIFQGYRNSRDGQEFSSIIMPAATAVGVVVALEAISSFMATSGA